MVFENGAAKSAFKDKSAKIASLNLLDEQQSSVYISVEDKDLNELISLLSSLSVRSFSNRKETLEDYFMKFYKEDKDFGGALK